MGQTTAEEIRKAAHSGKRIWELQAYLETLAVEAEERAKAQPEKLWLNAMNIVRPSPELKADIGGEIIAFLLSSQRPEPDEFGLRPWKRVVIEVTAS